MESRVKRLVDDERPMIHEARNINMLKGVYKEHMQKNMKNEGENLENLNSLQFEKNPISSQKQNTIKKKNPNNFRKLQNLLKKLFLNKPISQKDTNLKQHEKTLLKCILVKKKYRFDTEQPLSLENIKKLQHKRIRKKKEYGLKFAIMRTFNQLKRDFLDAHRLKSESSTQKTRDISSRFHKSEDIYFYTHYFGEYAKRQNLPIESFFVFKNWSHRYNANIPKSITAETIKAWKTNALFKHKVLDYLDKNFYSDFEEFNTRKIGKLMCLWETTAKKFGLNKAMQWIMESMSKKGCKLPWTWSEVEHAIECTRRVFEA